MKNLIVAFLNFTKALKDACLNGAIQAIFVETILHVEMVYYANSLIAISMALIPIFESVFLAGILAKNVNALGLGISTTNSVKLSLQDGRFKCTYNTFRQRY
jgi:hypothetical protein